MGIKSYVATVVVVFLSVTLIGLSGKLVEYLPADEVMMIQYPNGSLRACTEPGYYPQWFGQATKYKRRSQFWFALDQNAADMNSQSLKIRFNDNAHADIAGSLNWEMPTQESALIELYKSYGSQDKITKELIGQQTNKSIYMTGSLMSSKESAAEKRPELLNYLEDQIQNGVYRTQNRTITEVDQDTSITKTVVLSSIVTDSDGKPQRVEESLLKKYQIKASSVSINNIKYDQKVEEQLQQQQQAIMDIQTAIAESKKAEQRKLTVEVEGQTKAAEAKWEQETIKAKEVTKAEQEKQVAETLAQQKLEVARLETQASEEFKKSETLRGEGEAARKKLVMEADGALEKKLEAYVAVNEHYANALKDFNGNLVPAVVMGDRGSGNQSSATDLIDLFLAKTASDLSLNASFSTTTTTK